MKVGEEILSEIQDAIETKQKGEFKKPFYPIDFAQLGKLVLKDLSKNQTINQLYSKYTKQDIIRFMENPERYEKQLRELSRFLYINSNHYKRSILHFALLHKLDYVIEPYGINSKKINERMFKQSYQYVADVLENMNIKHELRKIMTVGFREDVFYGVERLEKDSYFIQQLPPEYCQITGICDGTYTFSFDFSFFNKDVTLLENYPKSFTKLYNEYKKDTKLKWKEIEPDESICIKINEDSLEVIPFLAGVFIDVFDLNDYKLLRKAKEELNNYAVLVEKIPINKDSETANDFALELETAKDFHNKASQALPDQVGLMLSPFESVDLIKFDKDRSESDAVAKAERDYYSSVGLSQLLFNGENASGASLKSSITADSIIVFNVARQIERWINRKLKSVNKNYKFKMRFLDVTWFNETEVLDNTLKLAQYGVPVKAELCALKGITPASLEMQTYLENIILDIPNTWLPLTSSHTQTTDAGGQGGRTPMKEEDLSEEGLKTRDGGTDDKANRDI
jgi:hypothetical protein